MMFFYSKVFLVKLNKLVPFFTMLIKLKNLNKRTLLNLKEEEFIVI